MEYQRRVTEQTIRNRRVWFWSQQGQVTSEEQQSPLTQYEEYSGDSVNVSTTKSETPAGDIEGVYVISVAARILRMHPQTLRKYERAGLVRPSRTIGMLRLYSEEDIAKLRLIKHLVDDLRLNLAGVDLALNLIQSFSAIHRQSLLKQEAQQLRKFISRELDDLSRILEI